MKNNISQQQLSDLTLLLLYLNSWEEKESDIPVVRAWKNHDFHTIDNLDENDFISHSKTAKSLYLTEKGVEKAKELMKLFEYLK